MNKEEREKEEKALEKSLLKIRKDYIEDVNWNNIDSIKIGKIYYILKGIY